MKLFVRLGRHQEALSGDRLDRDRWQRPTDGDVTVQIAVASPLKTARPAREMLDCQPVPAEPWN